MARGFFRDTDLDPAQFSANDIRRSMPRFAPENYAANLMLLAPFKQIARDAGCTSAQLALAWLLHKAPHIIPIPGTTSVEHLLEDMATDGVKLNADIMARLEELINQKTVTGSRYGAQGTGEVDTEMFS